MPLIDHIRACNAHDLAGYVRFLVSDQPLGFVRRDVAGVLIADTGLFEEVADGLVLVDEPPGFAERSDLVDRAVGALVDAGVVKRRREEYYPAVTGWQAAPFFRVDRAAVPTFGLRAYGLHVNGYVRRPDGLHMWVGIRARDKSVAPGKLDNLVAGGQPIGLTVRENLVKEAAEEAAIPAELAMTARAVGQLTYVMEQASGLKPDTVFAFDLELPADFVPENTDGEVERFELLPLEAVREIVETSDRFKFNCNLVIIDFLIRHGLVGPDDPGYADLVTGLHAPLP